MAYMESNKSFSPAEMYTPAEKGIFVEAKKLGIHRTVHAGEGGPAANVIAVSLNKFNSFLNWAIPGLFFLYFRLFNTVDSKQLFNKFCR